MRGRRVHLITHAMTTAATVYEARCTEAVHAALAGRGLVPATHLVDAAYVDAEFLVRSREDHGIELVGPPRPSPVWRGKARSRAATRPTVDGRSGPAARKGSCPRPGSRTSTGARATSWSASPRPTAAPARRGPCARAPGASPAACGCTRGPSTRRSRPPGNDSRPRRAGAATAGGPGSRAPCPGVCVPSACAAAATADWPGRACSTWRPRPRSTSSASPPSSGRPRAPPPAPPALPPSPPPEPTSPAVSQGFRRAWRPGDRRRRANQDRLAERPGGVAGEGEGVPPGAAEVDVEDPRGWSGRCRSRRSAWATSCSA